MCGIAGIWHRDRQRPAEPAPLAAMADTLQHRGPDDRGLWAGRGGGLAATRLSIVDVAGGHQPLTSEDRQVGAVLNGEIYNHRRLRLELEAAGHTFCTRVDTEVLVHGYEAWGPRGLAERLEGMFAAAVYDRAAHRLVLIRDRLGVKPLYHGTTAAGLVFGSEVKALLAHRDVARRLDAEGIDLFLTLEFTPAPRTLLADVRKLVAGTLLVADERGVRTERYWRLPPPAGAEAPATPAQAAAEVGARIERSVEDRLMADVPLGALLSGGIDSSSVVRCMARLGVDPLRTFSVGFREPSYDESVHAEAVARHFGACHHAAGLVPRAVELVDRLLPFLDDPIGDFSIFPTYLVSCLARQHVKVVLSGDGGDEVFGGYDTYLAEKLAQRLAGPARIAGRAAHRLGRRMRPREAKKGLWNLSRRFLEGLGHPAHFGHMRWMLFLAAADKDEAYGPALREGLGDFEAATVLDEALAGDGHTVTDPLERSLRLDLRLYLPENILLKLDRMSMATSLEARVPLLDHRLVEYVAQLPARYKVRGLVRKWILRRAVARWLPRRVLARRKTGFSIPMKTWLRHDLRHLVEGLDGGALVREHGLVAGAWVRRLVEEHITGRADHAHRLWSLVMLEAWLGAVLKAGPRDNRNPVEENPGGRMTRDGR
ncbi:MAG: asparagine synthase (glutamine-hydrolyzing) [Planctomycetes bacterium]|nr:asparagine synthase (glutamine-hydrolyzing) [Planctomycetota bacterium]